MEIIHTARTMDPGDAKVGAQLRVNLTCALLLILAACQAQESHEQSGATRNSPVVAQVAGKNFHETDIDVEIATLPERLQYLRDDPRLRARILKTIVRRYVLSQRAQAMHLEAMPAVRHRIDRARESILIQALEQTQSKNLAAPSDKEIRAYYQRHQSEFATPEQIHARHILVSSRKKAERILYSLSRGKDFSALAAASSLDDSNKSRGGDLNWFSRGSMVRPFEEAAFALKKKDALSKPVKTRFGWHIIQLLGRKPASLQSLDEAHTEIVELLRQQALAGWVEKTMQEAGARILKAQYRRNKQTGRFH